MGIVRKKNTIQIKQKIDYYTLKQNEIQNYTHMYYIIII